jgi:DNA repair protein RAD5
MSLEEVEERPAKKRRFLIGDSLIPDRSGTPETSPSPEENTPQDPTPQSSSQEISNRASDPFDVELLNGIVGEELPASTVDRLRELSGNNTERGRHISARVRRG